MSTTFTVDRKDLRQTHWVTSPPVSLDAGQVRLRVDRFALTSNNITYGAFGDAMNYWGFFPTGDEATGAIPVWGFATVLESASDAAAPGDRFYGYLPMADEVVLGPVRGDGRGFVDAAPHRQELHAVYNQYLRTSRDPLYRPQHEDLLMLLRPLFMTSFLIDDFLADNAWFGARRVLVSSASSKTGYGLGFCLAQRRGEDDAPVVVGLTSAGNLDFTRRLGCFDEVMAYGDIDEIDVEAPAVYVDMSGNAALRHRIHARWGDALKHSCSVGGTHWQELGGGKGLPGPRPVLFFAPAQAKKRAEEWGASGLQNRLASAWLAFVEQVAGGPAPWLRVVMGQGRGAVETTYQSLLQGTLPADEGRVLSLP